MSVVKTFDEMDAEQKMAYMIGYRAAMDRGEKLWRCTRYGILSQRCLQLTPEKKMLHEGCHEVIVWRLEDDMPSD